MEFMMDRCKYKKNAGEIVMGRKKLTIAHRNGFKLSLSFKLQWCYYIISNKIIPSIGIKPDNGARCVQTKLFEYFFKCPFYCVNNPCPFLK